jgi:NAD(P)-dependent dehydrogenase (short-subunit alcohol dehydrogenase family)
MSFSGRVCLVTGASSGIGRRTALDLAQGGARVCVAARREDRLRSLVEDMGGEARGHSYVVTDVSVKKDVAGLAKAIEARYGRLDVLINNAGFSRERPSHQKGFVADLEKIMKTNFYGVVYCTNELLPLLLKSAPSSVVNVASFAGRLALGATPAYSASKFAVVGLSEALHFQLAEKGISVSVVEPGLIPTEGFPQAALVDDPVLKYALGTEEDVSRAIRDAVERRKMERVVPRWYYLLQLPRLLAPPLYRLVQRRMVLPRQRAMEADG